MRFPRFLFIILFSLSANGLIGQNDTLQFSRDAMRGDMTNVDVIDAKRWQEQGLNEKSLKKGLEILSSHIELTTVDSFNTYQTIALNFRAMGAFNPALEYAEKAAEIRPRLESGSRPTMHWMAPYYSATKRYDTAVIFMKQDISIFKNSMDTLGLLKLYNDIGFTYSLDNQIDSAITYYNKVIDSTTKSDKYKGVLGLATGNLGIIYLNRGEYKKALGYIEIDARLNKDRDVDSYYNAVNSIGECYFLMKDYAKAKTALLKLEDVNPSRPKTKLKTYDLLAKAYENTNDHAQSIFYLKKHRALKEELESAEIPIESVLTQLTELRVSGIKKDLEISKGKVDLMNSELLLAQNKVRSQTLKTRVYLVLVILGIITVVILVLNYKGRQRKNQKIYQLETELITAELHNKKQDLTNLVTNLSYVRKFIDQVEGKLKTVLRDSEGTTKEELSSLIREFSTYKSADKSLAVLQSDIETVNLSFFKKLEEQFPALTQNERELCGLLVLKLSTKDIAVIRNVSPNAVKKARQRIRKKLPISDSDKIVTFLESI